MLIVKQSTARIVTVGPILDADGVAVTDSVIGDLKISKNGGVPAALNGSATLTHRATGHYSLSLTTSDVDTVGGAEIISDDTVNAMPPKELMVVEEAIYDAMFAASATGLLPANVTQFGGTNGTFASGRPEVKLGDVAHGGTSATLRLGGSTSTPALYVTNSGGDAVQFESTGGNGKGLDLLGNGSGDGMMATGGATGDGLRAFGGATSGDGATFYAQTDGNGIVAAGTGTLRAGIVATSPSSGMILAGTSDGVGLQITGDGTGGGVLIQAGATGDGVTIEGGATSGDGLVITSPTSGVGLYVYSADANGILVYVEDSSPAVQFQNISSGDALSLSVSGGDPFSANAVEQIRDATVAEFVDDLGTAQAGGASTITLRSGASDQDNAYQYSAVKTTGGTGAGQTRQIASYVGSTRVANVDEAWTVQPDNTTTYLVLGRIV